MQVVSCKIVISQLWKWDKRQVDLHLKTTGKDDINNFGQKTSSVLLLDISLPEE
jgi:hypothetical protein